jgi:hypothetical protein
LIKFYTNRELSLNLQINLAKWKRWSREFLPPDPLGGMQSGYARQYSPAQAFKVYLGGYLVSQLRFTIPESKAILKDLKEWLADKGFSLDFNDKSVSQEGLDAKIIKYIIFIQKHSDAVENKIDFFYTARGIISIRPIIYQGFEIMQERYVETAIGSPPGNPSELDDVIVKTLDISSVSENFMVCLGL